MQTDRRIAFLASQLPQQRRQLVQQSRVVAQAVNIAVTSPGAVSLTVLCGAALGWLCFRPQQHRPTPVANQPTSADTAVLRQSLSAMFMAYLVRYFV